MKYLLIIAIVVAIIWLTRMGRAKPPSATPRRAAQTADDHEEMIACAHCGIHLPRSEAVTGERALLYCGEPHRLAHEAPPSARS